MFKVLLLLTAVNGYQRLSAAINGYQRLPTATNGYQRLETVYLSFVKNTKRFLVVIVIN